MSSSSILGGASAPVQADGKSVDLLGPSDSSDSGSDVQGQRPMATAPESLDQRSTVPAEVDSDTDASGTGERASADGDSPVDGADILPDRIIERLDDEDDPSARRKSVEAGALSDDDEAEGEIEGDTRSDR